MQMKESITVWSECAWQSKAIRLSLIYEVEEPNGNIPFPRSGSGILNTFTVGPSRTFVISCGVMRMYCFLSDVFAVSIIIRMLIRLLMASMKTSNSSESMD